MNTRSTRRPSRWAVRLVGVAAVLSALLTAGCGFDVQTLQPYTPADGVNYTHGDGVNGTPQLKVRNLFVLADGAGNGFVSASMIVDNGSDTLRSISGVALNADGSDGGAITVGTFAPLAIGTDRLLVLTDEAPITVSGPLRPGFEARLTLTFAEAGEISVVTPVIASSDPVYSGLTPSPTASASPTS